MKNLLLLIILSFLIYSNCLPDDHEELLPGIGTLKILPLKKSKTSILNKLQKVGPSFIIKVPENMYYRPNSLRITSQTIYSTKLTTFKPKITTTKNIDIPPSAKISNNINEKSLTLKEIAIITCKKIDTYRNIYNVKDIQIFARDNCFIIQIYYPDISCHDIKEIVDYCVEKNFFKE
uniref:Ground-like domain-containing protein n=1 Tax=Strongyloides stercoralis TaxID=6248 RepID=A0A0K0ECY5_STRER